MEERKDICEGYERDSVQQLDKLAKDKNERFPIYPLTYIQAVYDARTKERLDSILWKCNNVYLPWMGSAGDTRIQLPFWMRRKGIIITYKNLEEETITEKLTYDLCIADDFFRLDSSWTRITDALPVGGNITIGSNGNWFQDGVDTGFKAQGPKGDNGLTPMLRTVNNKLRYSYDGEVWYEISEYIAAWFRYQDNKIQISRDQKTWSDLSKPFTQDLYIKGYVATSSALPSTGVKQGDIYMVGPTYAAEDSEHKNPIYRMYVYNDSGWVDNGVFQSIAAGVVQTIGNSETEVMSQKAVSSIVGLDTYPVFSDTKPYVKGDIVNYGGLLYEFTADHEAGAWIGTDARETSLRREIVNLGIKHDSYSGYLPVDYGHLYSYNGGNGSYVANNLWDAVTFRIYNPTGRLEVTGANVAFFIFFDETRIKDTYLDSNTTGIIPAGAKLCVLDMRKSDNPNGYANLRIRQYGSGADKGELSLLNESALQVFSDVYNMAVKFDDEDITPEAIAGQYFNPNVSGLVANENFKCYKLDVSGYVGKVLHGYTYTSGTMWSCSMTDENNVVLAKFNYRTRDDRQSNIIDRMFYIGSGVKYLYINCAVSYMGAFIKTTKRKLNTNKVDIFPVNMKMRDVATYIGEPFVIPNHYGELSGDASDNGNIKPSANFDLVVIKLLSRKPIIVEGATCKFYLFYNSGDLKNETYLGNNRTGDYIAGAQYAALLFEKSTGSKGLNYNQIRIVQDGTVIKHDDVLRQHNIETLTPDEVVHGYFIMPDGSTQANASFRYERYNLPNVFYDTLLFSAQYGSHTNIAAIFYFDKDDNLISKEYDFNTSTTGGIIFNNAPLHIPDNAAYILFNIRESSGGTMYMKTVGEYYDLGQMETDIENIKGGKKLIKLHVYDTEPGRNENAFYVRAKYNDTKDILLLYYINLNTLLSPKTAYIGANTLSDADLMASANIVSNHSDSTAPLFQSSLYWHLYAQHGYVIPVVPNTVGLTTADIGALWKDQLDRQYNIGNVIGSSIYLLPVITRGAEGNDTRGWKTPNNPAITALTHVSGGTVTTPITVASQSTTQLRPIMKHENRKFYIDGRELTEPGDYEGDDFTVSESQTGYDPASIETWFPTPGVIGTPDLTGAVEMARFTWSYNFRGAQCCVNTTIDIRRKVECQSYGATQQQTFVDTGNYKAMFMIPKAAPQGGTELDKPFNSPALTSGGYSFFRNTTYLKDVDKPIDRLIAMLHNPNDNTYLVGMAAGLSLVSGETIPAKRNANIPIAPNANDVHYRLGSFSPSNNNKFYIAAINTSPFADDGYNLPNTYFKEINYYISYFDPAANPGQLYWYKDGNSYIIYSHCQSEQSRVPLTLPDFMEGLNVEIVEQTDNAVLLTDTVQNGKLFVSYNTDESNYIVLKTK
jgi:hypothetical protein